MSSTSSMPPTPKKSVVEQLKPYWWVLIPVTLFCIAMIFMVVGILAILNQPATQPPTPTLNPENTIPPTRTTLPEGIIPTTTALPTRAALQPTIIQPTAVVLPTTIPFFTATPFPTPLPTSTPLPAPNISIYSPANNNIIAGIIQILGSAKHPYFVQYQLEFSPDPGDLWALIPGTISNQSIENGILGLWDTRQTPDGIYQLRLRVFTVDGSSTVYVIHNLRVSNFTPTPPPSATPIPSATPTPTLTITPLPTSTPLPTFTPVPTDTPTSTSLPTDAPTLTALPTVEEPSATPIPTDTPFPTDEIQPPADLETIPVIPALSPAAITYLRGIYENGLNNFGNQPTVFAKIGDDNTASANFLTGFGDGTYNLDTFAYLQPTIDYFSTIIRDEGGIIKNSFNATSFAANPGWTITNVLDTGQANPSVCAGGETPLACDIRLTRPSMQLVMFGTHDVVVFNSDPEAFRSNLQTLLNISLTNGVIPIVSTIPERLDGSVTAEQIQAFNTIIVDTATSANVPLWNLWLALYDLPNSGISPDGVTLSTPPDTLTTDLSAYGLNYGFNQKNLTALQVLGAVQQAIFPDALPPVLADTATPTATAIAIVPTDTPLPSPTETPIPTETPTFTPEPTATETPTEEPLPPTETPTFTPEPTATETPTEEPPPAPPSIDLNTIPVLPDFEANPAMANVVQLLYSNSQNIGLTQGVFTQTGDVLATDMAFLKEMISEQIQWDIYQAELEPVWQSFQVPVGEYTSFTRPSLAANHDWTTGMLLDPALADPTNCQPGETPLQCEIRITKPLYMIVSVGRADTEKEVFQNSLNTVVQTITGAGVIPILTTLPGNEQVVGSTNVAIVEVAQNNNVPIWNLWLALRDLPENGVNSDLSLRSPEPGQNAIFTADYLQFGSNQANLSALQLLKALENFVKPNQ